VSMNCNANAEKEAAAAKAEKEVTAEHVREDLAADHARNNEKELLEIDDLIFEELSMDIYHLD